MQERVRYEHQTPMFSDGFSVPHAVLVQAQMAFTILIKGLNRPALQIQGDNPLCPPVGSVGHQHGIGARQLGIRETHDQPDLAQARMRTARVNVQ